MSVFTVEYIMSNPNLINSAKQLANYLTDRTLTEFKVIKPEPHSEIQPIMWGIGKGYTRTGLSEALKRNNIPTIEYHHNVPNENDYPVVIRTILDGNGGKGIIIAKTREEFMEYRGNIWSKWINFDFELGVHAINGTIQRIFKKICMDDEREFPIRNIDNNYHFSIRNIEKYKKLPEFVSNLHRVLQFEICRYDIGWDKENQTYVCIEANTAPSLSNNFSTLSMYGDYYISKLGLQRR